MSFVKYDVIIRARQGDEDAFTSLVDAYQVLISHFGTIVYTSEGRPASASSHVNDKKLAQTGSAEKPEEHPGERTTHNDQKV